MELGCRLVLSDNRGNNSIMRGTRFAQLIEFDNVSEMADVNGGVGIGVKNSLPYMKRSDSEYQIAIEKWDKVEEIPYDTDTTIFDINADLRTATDVSAVFYHLTFHFGGRWNDTVAVNHYALSAFRSMKFSVIRTGFGRDPLITVSDLMTEHAGILVKYTDSGFDTIDTRYDLLEEDIRVYHELIGGNNLIRVNHKIGGKVQMSIDVEVKTQRKIIQTQLWQA